MACCRGGKSKTVPSSHRFSCHPSLGDLEKAVTELIIDFNTSTEEEGPYEALYNAVSCQSLDSTASGRSSDRDSVSREAEAAGGKAAGVRPVCGRGSAVTSALLGNRGREVWPPVPAASQRPGPPPPRSPGGSPSACLPLCLVWSNYADLVEG